jgi:hypothetical protein
LDVPSFDEFKTFGFRDFRAKLDFYLARSIMRRASPATKNSVAIPPGAKEKIRDYVRAMRECIEKSEIDKARREKLLDRLDEFERELEKRRLTMITIAKIALAIAAAPGGLDSTDQMIERLRSNILREVETAKTKEEEARRYLNEAQPPLQLAPPKPAREIKPFGKSSARRQAIDDAIPF